MNDETLKEAIQRAKATRQGTVDKLNAAIAVTAMIEASYIGTGSREGNRIQTRARKAREALAELLTVYAA